VQVVVAQVLAVLAVLADQEWLLFTGKRYNSNISYKVRAII
jgi:hypothetical protein